MPKLTNEYLYLWKYGPNLNEEKYNFKMGLPGQIELYIDTFENKNNAL